MNKEKVARSKKGAFYVFKDPKKILEEEKAKLKK